MRHNTIWKNAQKAVAGTHSAQYQKLQRGYYIVKFTYYITANHTAETFAFCYSTNERACRRMCSKFVQEGALPAAVCYYRQAPNGKGHDPRKGYWMSL